MGPTEFQEGHWIGVVLDEPRGKNNGNVRENRILHVRTSMAYSCVLLKYVIVMYNYNIMYYLLTY